MATIARITGRHYLNLDQITQVLFFKANDEEMGFAGAERTVAHVWTSTDKRITLIDDEADDLRHALHLLSEDVTP